MTKIFPIRLATALAAVFAATPAAKAQVQPTEVTMKSLLQIFVCSALPLSFSGCAWLTEPMGLSSEAMVAFHKCEKAHPTWGERDCVDTAREETGMAPADRSDGPDPSIGLAMLGAVANNNAARASLQQLQAQQRLQAQATQQRLQAQQAQAAQQRLQAQQAQAAQQVAVAGGGTSSGGGADDKSYKPYGGCMAIQQSSGSYCIRNSCSRVLEAHFSGGMMSVGAGECRPISGGATATVYAACEKDNFFDRSRGLCRR